MKTSYTQLSSKYLDKEFYYAFGFKRNDIQRCKFPKFDIATDVDMIIVTNPNLPTQKQRYHEFLQLG